MKAFWLCLILFICNPLISQESKNDRIEILKSRRVTVLRMDTASVTILSGDVALRNGDGLFYCDSARWWRRNDRFIAFGNIRFIGNNGLKINANNLDFKKGLADLSGDVVLRQDGQTLETNQLMYQTKEEVGWYNNGGKMISNDGQLTSIAGRFIAKEKLFIFQNKVHATTEDYIIDCEKISQYPERSIYIISSKGTAKSKSGKLIFGSAIINNNLNISSFFKGVEGYDSTLTFQADSLYKSDEKEITRLYGNDSIPAKWANFTKDSLEIHSGFIEHESNFTTAVNNVITFQNNLVTHSQNLTWKPLDSIIFIWGKSTAWSGGYQVISDSLIYVFGDEHNNDSLFGIGHINISSAPDSSGLSDEMCGKVFTGFINEGRIDKLAIRGNAVALIHPETEQTSNIKCSEIELNFKENKLTSIRFIKGPEGNVQNEESDTFHLPNYEDRWNSQPRKIESIFGRK